jgi:hypothetical protein
MSDSSSGVAADPRGDTVSAVALAKSGRVLCAFAHFYFPFYGKNPRDVFWQFDPFAWISSFVYDVDEEIERGRPPEEALSRLDNLAQFLSARIRLDPQVIRLFGDARQYYRFEHDVTRRGASYCLDDLAKITAVRSFDFRLMHRTLAQKSGRGYREELFNWFRALEMLMEIEDDMTSVRDDEQRGTFNILCLAARHASDKGFAFVERLRRQVEDELLLKMRALSDGEIALCTRTLETYRGIVRRPEL